jgi:hypothetical protein
MAIMDGQNKAIEGITAEVIWKRIYQKHLTITDDC